MQDAPSTPRNAAYFALSTALAALATARAELSRELGATEFAHRSEALKTAMAEESSARKAASLAYKVAIEATPRTSHVRAALVVECDAFAVVDSRQVKSLADSWHSIAQDDLEGVDAFAVEQFGTLDEGVPADANVKEPVSAATPKAG